MLARPIIKLESIQGLHGLIVQHSLFLIIDKRLKLTTLVPGAKVNLWSTVALYPTSCYDSSITITLDHLP